MKSTFLMNAEKSTLRSIAKNLGIAKVEKVSKTKLIKKLEGFSYRELKEATN